MANWIIKQEGSPTTPASGKNNLYFTTGGVLTSKNSAGATTTYPSGSGTAYVVGGTDVAVADGGTGASTAATARTNLGVAAAPAAGTHAARPAPGTAGNLYYETDTGVIYRDSGSVWVAITDGFIRKSADETVNNSNVLQNDDHLLFPVEANEVWFLETMLLVSAVSNASDFKAGLSVPAGCTYQITRMGTATGVGVGASPITLVTTSISTGSAGGTFPVQLWAWITNGATAGNTTLQWAQDTATAEDTKVLTNSFLRIRKLV